MSIQHIATLFSRHLPAPAKRSQHWTRHIITLFGALIARVWPSCSKLHEPGQTTITSCKTLKCGIKILPIFKFEPNNTKHVVAEDKCSENLEQVHWFSSALWNNMPVKVQFCCWTANKQSCWDRIALNCGLHHVSMTNYFFLFIDRSVYRSSSARFFRTWWTGKLSCRQDSSWRS